MQGFIEVESISNIIFQELSEVIITTKEGVQYSLTPNSVFCSIKDIETEAAVKILKCRIDYKLKFELSSEGQPFYVHKSDQTVKNIFLK